MDISFDYYKIFYEVAKAKSISLAAQYLCLTQPTITKYIQNLEQELHCKLFVRSRKGVSLTAEGQMLLRQVSRAVQQMERAGGMLQEFVNCQSGKINIGASELTMRYYLLPYLEQFRQQFPNVNLQIHAFSTPVSMSALSFFALRLFIRNRCRSSVRLPSVAESAVSYVIPHLSDKSCRFPAAF